MGDDDAPPRYFYTKTCRESNFYPHAFWHHGVNLPTSEHHLMREKALLMGRRRRVGTDRVVQVLVCIPHRPPRLLADYFLVRGPRVVVDALARMEGDSVEHADLHADFAELRKPPSLPTQRCASFAFSRTLGPPAQLSLWCTGWQ